MKDVSGTSGTSTAAQRSGTTGETAHEAYSFACMKCGYSWEQTYDIEHYVPAAGEPFVAYYTDGHRVPSPLKSPTCVNCDGHVLRIMRSGRVAAAQEAQQALRRS